MAPPDRSALHLHLLADLLDARQPVHDYANAVGCATWPSEVLDCGDVQNRDTEAASAMQAVLDGQDPGALAPPQCTADLHRAAVRLFRQASAHSLAGNPLLARAQADVASALCGLRPLKARTPDRLERLRSVFVGAMPGVTVSFGHVPTNDTVHPVLSRAPTDAELVALTDKAGLAEMTFDGSLLPPTRGLRSVVVPLDDADVLLQFTVAGDERP